MIGRRLSPKATAHPSDTCAVSPPIGLQELTAGQTQKLMKLIDGEKKQFESVTGVTTRAQHEIRLKDHMPIKQRYRPRTPALQDISNSELDKMLEEGVI